MWVYILKHKGEVLQRFQEWKALVEKSSGRKIKTLQSYNGGEYTSAEFSSYLAKKGIKHELTIPHTPQQNGVAERLNRTLIEGVRTMLADSKLPHRFWAEAISTAVYLRNRSPTKALEGVTPHEAWSGTKPDVSTLCVPMHMCLKLRDTNLTLRQASACCWAAVQTRRVTTSMILDI